MVRIKKAGFAKDTNAVYLGNYDKSVEKPNEMDQYGTNFSITEGGGVFHDLFRGWGIKKERTNVPSDVFIEPTKTNN